MLYGLGIGAVGAQAIAPQKIDPPLGLFWGESQKAIEEKNTPISERAVVMQRDAWTVDRFPDSGLKKAILYFGKEKTLVEVELQYDEPTWTFDDYQGFFASARRQLQERYGEPIVLARYKEPKDIVVETVVYLLWRGKASSVRLCYYAAERNTDLWRVVSLDYRAD
jgi:hypothetical protein